jgi:hypothetical protein
MIKHETELSLLVKGLPPNKRATLIKKLGTTQNTLYRWLRQPRSFITLETAPVFKQVLDSHYKADHDINALSKPVQIRGRKPVHA